MLKNKGVKIGIVVFLSFLFTVPFFIRAKSVYLDKETAKKGSTVNNDDGNVKATFGRGVLKGEASVTITDILPSEKDKQLLPKGLELVTEFYTLNINSKKKGFFKPYYVQVRIPESPYLKKIYFWDGANKVWKPLMAALNKNQKWLKIPLRSSKIKVAILSDAKKPMPPKKITSKSAPTGTGRAVAVLDVQSGELLYGRNEQELVTIASLTKLITASVFLETKPNLDKKISYSSTNDAAGAGVWLRGGDELKLRDAFYCSLVASANNMTKVVAHSTGLSDDKFVELMNKKAKSLNLKKTIFHEVTGLDPNNRSTAYEYAVLAKEALEKEEVRKAATTTYYSFKVLNTGTDQTIKNTNKLLFDSDLKIIGGKTGYLPTIDGGDGSSLAVEAKNDKGNEVIAVVLGHPAYQWQFMEVESLIRWAFENYEW